MERIEALQKEPLQKSPPWFFPDELWRARCTQVPGEAGVYYVLLHNGEPKFREDPRGGRAIWQVEQREELRFSWQVCPEADELEKQLLRRYYETFHCYPVANRRN